MGRDTQAATELAYRYEERPRTSPLENEAFDPPTEYVNLWDANPADHGGLFLKWNGSEWTGILVRPMSEYMKESCECEYWVEHVLMEPHDVWVDPDDPMTEFTDKMAGELAQFNGSPDLPNAPPFLADVTHYVAGLVHSGYHDGQPNEHTVADRCDRSGAASHDPDDCEFDTYADLLASYGVDDWD